ncbi:4-(cytidine 5'-diphospho)-2-C-methyl-D-erythritol kinase [Chloroflexota bacterium]
MLTLIAPAKINLTLEVLAERMDGFHEIRSVIQTIDLSDTLHFRSGQEVTIISDTPEWNAAESLVSRTVDLLRQETGSSQGVTIEIEKRIPLTAGLGGDSSDAAAVLMGLNSLWGLNLPLEKLFEFARQLGSDVSFFLYGGTALLEGRGEIVTPLPTLLRCWLVLALPPVPRLPEKTKQLYRALGVNHYTDGQITRNFIEKLKTGSIFENSLLFNTFENVAFSLFPGLGIARDHFIKLGAESVHLAGSGPTLFTLFEDKDRAERLFLLLREQRMEPYLVETLSSVEKRNLI